MFLIIKFNLILFKEKIMSKAHYFRNLYNLFVFYNLSIIIKSKTIFHFFFSS